MSRRRAITGTFTRRRFLTIAGAAAIVGGPEASSRGEVLRWRGTALGADASISFAGIDAAAAQSHTRAVRAEIDRIESLFSLYRKGSALRRLNSTGRLEDPAPDFVRLMRLAGRVHDRTDGAFDPTVQSLWQLHAKSAAGGDRARSSELSRVARSGGWHNVRVSAEIIAFARPGMSITLNGIAQGHAADRISRLLQRRGLQDVLIDAGEIVARGNAPAGEDWRAAARTPDGQFVREIRLGGRALATSAPNATMVNPAGGIGHILDPRSGHPADRWRLVSVSAASAAVADALSTAFCLMHKRDIDVALSSFSDAALEVALPT